MASKLFNVLRVNSVEETARYRSAVATVLVNIQSEFEMTHLEIANAIDVSLGTISNAANKKADLSSVYLQRIGKVFGGHVLNPVAALHGSQMIPLYGRDGDILPLVARVGLRIAEARCPSSEGGATETHRERLQYLPDLKRLQAELAALVVQIEGIKAA